MKNLLFFLLFINSIFLNSQLEISTEHNPNWKYKWYHDNVDLGITSSKIFSVGKDVCGEYKVMVFNGCDTIIQSIKIKKTKNKKEYYLGDVGIDECLKDEIYNEEWYQKLESELEFIIFPNPTREIINLRIYRGHSEYYLVNIYDQMGKLVLEKKSIKEDQINISNLSLGIYIFEVVSDDTRKCVLLNLQ